MPTLRARERVIWLLVTSDPRLSGPELDGSNAGAGAGAAAGAGWAAATPPPPPPADGLMTYANDCSALGFPAASIVTARSVWVAVTGIGPVARVLGAPPPFV
jgi:hypothetical protein